ncbi:hypothetical protein [Nocardia sp. BMG51109]|uniref:hypothetical protein n=1 Tax=Nocardia sp. BMG51109 TaxID=1056816 RepID=UPI0004662B6D|nr:hypothetical protein [Nocardia sp. BMG51109]
MTGTNPPHNRDEPAQSGQPNETVQWWSTPPASAGTPVTGTEPTVLGGGRPQGPVTGTDPTVLGAGFDNYVGASQPQYPQQAPPPGQPQQQPGYPPPPPYGNPPYGQQQFPGRPYPPPKKSSAVPWIIGGAVGLVVVIGAVIGIAVLAANSDDNGGGGGGLTGKGNKAEGNYSMAKATNACMLVDTTVLSKWAPIPDGAPEHTERQPTSYDGGSLECKASYTGAGKYGDDGSDLDLEADFQGEYGSPSFNTWKQMDTQTSGSGRTSGTITGLGQDAYYAANESIYSSFTSLDYTCAVLDSNLSARVKLSIDTPSPTNKQEVDTVCKDELKKVLTSLHK